MRSAICIIIVLAIDSSFELFSFRAIELFFFCFFLSISTLINYIIKYYKHVFNYYKHILYSIYTRYNNFRIDYQIQRID